MKHVEERHTCDRCKSEIKLRDRKELKYTRLAEYLDAHPVYENGDIVGEISEVKKANLLFGTKIIELCPRCREEFERFMKNE